MRAVRCSSAAGNPAPCFDGVNNFRDLAEAHAAVRPGAVFRTAAPVGASTADVCMLFDQLAIRDLLDLRSTEELRMDGAGSAAFEGISFCKYYRDAALGRVRCTSLYGCC